MKTIKTIALLALVCVFLVGGYALAANNSKEDEETCGGAVESATQYDITALEAWCGETVGACRMIGGWYFDEGVIETQDGNLWRVNTNQIGEWEFLLIWFDDMGTTDEIGDDQIVKIWSEVYD